MDEELYNKHFLKKTKVKWVASQENLSSRFPTRSDTNRAVQPQKMAGGLKFRI